MNIEKTKGTKLPHENWRSWLFPCGLLLTSWLFLAWLNFYPQQSKPVIVLFHNSLPPSEHLASAIKAGATILGSGKEPGSLIVQSSDPDFFNRLYLEGAWLIADAAGKAGCGNKLSLK